MANAITLRDEGDSYPRQACHGAKVLGGAIRVHRGIENRAYYVRDAIPGEACQPRPHRAGAMARIRSVALNILRADGVQNVSLAL